MEDLKKQILYIDLDNVLVDFQSGIDQLDKATRQQYEGRLDEVPGIFALMNPLRGAVTAFRKLSKTFDTYILSTAPWENPSAWSDKLEWVKKHLGKAAYKRLILTHHKELNRGDFLIDDRKKNGAENFEGELIPFGSAQFPNWKSVVEYLTTPSQPTTPQTYKNIEEILTLRLPHLKDTFFHRIKNKKQKFKEVAAYYEVILDEIVEQVKAGKYGNLDHEDLYNPNSGWYQDIQSFTFEVGDYDIIVNLEDRSIDAEDHFNKVIAHIESTVYDTYYEDAEIPEDLQALELDADCEFECLEEVLDTLFTEIGKCKKKYDKLSQND